MMKLTPVLCVDNIEESLPFWIDRFGFSKTAEVPDGDRLGFVILEREGAVIMLQTWDSIEKDAPAALKGKQRNGDATGIFIVVSDFDDVRKRAAGADVLVPERVTFYHMREIALRAPSGHTVVFAVQESE